MTQFTINMKEWQRKDPVKDKRLAGFSFGDDQVSRQLAERLTELGRLETAEMIQGLRIRSNSYVGNIQLGRLRLIIQPKISGRPLVNLIRYAYKLRNLDLFDPAEQSAGESTFQDLLIYQLAAESRELISRGLHRSYTRIEESLASPRGRIDLQRYAQHGGLAMAALPCTYYPRLNNTLINQVLMSGLYFSARMTADLTLRARLRRLAMLLADDVSQIDLDQGTMNRAWRTMDRRTAAYEPSLTLIALLLNSTSVLLQEQGIQIRVPGFLFDMNLFFERVLARFLSENLPGCVVQDNRSLKAMFRYRHNPKGWRTPTPRPDFIIHQNCRIKAILDAKYIDLWQRSPSRDILYQLGMYALSQGQGKEATILYPTTSTEAQEAVLDVNDPVQGKFQVRIRMRPVHLFELERLATGPSSPIMIRDRVAFARHLAFGERAYH